MGVKDKDEGEDEYDDEEEDKSKGPPMLLCGFIINSADQTQV